MIKLRWNRRCVFFVFLLIPFFELYTFDMLINKNIYPVFFETVTTLFSLGRIGITAIMIADLIYCKKFPSWIVTWGVGFYCLSCIITSQLNGSLYINYMIGNITYIGLALLCEKLTKKSLRNFYESVMVLFGFYSIVGAITIFIMPNGFFGAATKAEAVYFLGSKNSSFFYFFMFTFFAFYGSLYWKGKLSRTDGLISIIFIAAARICDSSNSLLCLLIIFGYYLILKYGYKLYKLLNGKTMFLLFLFLAICIIFSINQGFIKTIVEMLGRDTTYTGRSALWNQAIKMFVEHPLIGNGIRSMFQLETKVWATHAHNVYLDILAKYGIFPLFFLLGTVVLILRKIAKCRNKKLVNLIGIFVFTILLHNIFDDVSMYVLVLLFSTCETIEDIQNAIR